MVKKLQLFLKDIIFSSKTNQRAVHFGFISLFFIILSSLLIDPYLNILAMYDIWISQVGAHAIKHGMVLHEDFHSPFGFIYNSLNYASLLIIESFPNIFNLFDMIMLSSVLFSFIIIGLFYLMRVNTAKIMPIALLLIILSIIPQLRSMSEMFNIKMSYLMVDSYNRHVWGLFLLQVIHLFCWKKSFIKNPEDTICIKRSSFVLFLTIQVICAYIFFNYKINFFVASTLLIFSIFFILPLKSWFKYIGFSISLFLSLILFTFILTQYSYIGYLKDVYHVSLSRQWHYINLNYFFLYLFLFAFFRVCTQLFREKPKNLVEFFAHQSRLFLANNKPTLIKWFLFDLFIGIFLSIGISFNSQRSLLYFLIAILSYLLVNIKTINIQKGFYWGLIVLFVINISFLINTYLGLNYLLTYVFIFFLIRISILLSIEKFTNKIKPTDIFKYYFYKSKDFSAFSCYFHNIRSFFKNNKLFFVRYFLFDLCIGVSTYLYYIF